MPVFFQQYQEIILTLLKKLFKKNFFIAHRLFLPFGRAYLPASSSL